MKKPTIVIVAGGKNSRFFPLNTKTHKGFLPIAGEPLIIRALKNLNKNGFSKIIIVVSNKDYENKNFRQNIKKENPTLEIKFVLQKKAKGMGNALLEAEEYLKNDDFILSSPYYINIGDRANILWNKKQTSRANCVFFGTKTKNPEMYGILKFEPTNQEKVIDVVEKVNDLTGKVKSLIEKANDLTEKVNNEVKKVSKGNIRSNKINNEKKPLFKIDSTYLFDNGFFEELNTANDTQYSLETAISSYAKKVKIAWIENTQQIQSLKYPWHLFNLFSQIMIKEKTSISKNTQIAKTAIIDDAHGPVVIKAGVIIKDFVKILGPCYIGNNVLVGDFSFVRDSSLEDNVTIGANSEVTRSIFFKNSSFHFGYIADSIIGEKTKIGAGLLTANKRFDRAKIKTKIKNKMINTQLKSLGMITGNNVTIGIGVKTIPGVLVEENTIIYPGTIINKNVNSNKL